jgi:hypothetical protein
MLNSTELPSRVAAGYAARPHAGNEPAAAFPTHMLLTMHGLGGEGAMSSPITQDSKTTGHGVVEPRGERR